MVRVIDCITSKKWGLLWILSILSCSVDGFYSVGCLHLHRGQQQGPPSRQRFIEHCLCSQHPDDLSIASATALEQDTCTLTSFQDLNNRIYLLSLKWPEDDASQISFSAQLSVRDIWKWKDRVLGDGRDFFVPKPRILQTLQEWIIQQTQPLVDECAILSNCARFEVLLVLSSSVTTTTTTTDEVILQISACFQAQVKEFYQRRPMTALLLDPLSSFDWPGIIDTSIDLTPDRPPTRTGDNDDISQAWTRLQGISQVARHLSLVASGMALRPSRPGRAVPFRPFSARDAHIMLQLKRTQQIFGTTQHQPCLSVLFETALRAGKAARTVACVPELEWLLKYGTGNSKYEAEPPEALMAQVAKAARIKAVEPMVVECVGKFKAMQASHAIAQLRQAAEALLHNCKRDERRWMQQRLHQPTMQLRKGECVDVHQLITSLQRELQLLYHMNSTDQDTSDFNYSIVDQSGQL